MLISEKLQVTAVVFGDCLAISQHTNVTQHTDGNKSMGSWHLLSSTIQCGRLSVSSVV